MTDQLTAYAVCIYSFNGNYNCKYYRSFESAKIRWFELHREMVEEYAENCTDAKKDNDMVSYNFWDGQIKLLNTITPYSDITNEYHSRPVINMIKVEP